MDVRTALILVLAWLTGLPAGDEADPYDGCTAGAGGPAPYILAAHAATAIEDDDGGMD